MADLRGFAQRIQAIAREVEDGSNELTIQTALVIDQILVLTTPVDTGRARANWLVGIDRPIVEPTDREDPSGGQTIATNNEVIRSRNPEQGIYISNNLPYINRLNLGHSAQAPGGFIQAAVKRGIATVRRGRVLG